MYICRNCGLKYPVDAAVLCMRCQASKGMGNQFCPCCGNPMPPVAQICMNCGVDTTQYGMPESEKSKVAAGLFGIFFGSLGVHSFYLGYISGGIRLFCCSWYRNLGLDRRNPDSLRQDKL